MQKTYGSIHFDKANSQWLITAAQPHICIRLKSIFSQLAKSGSLPFKFPHLPGTCTDLLWFLQRYPLQISDKDLNLLKKLTRKYHADINELERILLPDYVPVSTQLREGEEARHYQLTGCEVYLKKQRLLIGDDLGLGKTLIAILSFLDKRTLPAQVVVQTHLPKQWKEEIEYFTGLRVHLIKGTKPYTLPPADVYITKYSCLAGWSSFFHTGFFRSAVFDEVQELRRCESDRYKAAQLLSSHVKYCMGLSATPIYNYGDEIYNVLDALNPCCLGDRYDFLREWTDHSFKVVKDPNALGTFLRENMLMLRRTRAEVGRELPPINKIIHQVPFNQTDFDKSEAVAVQLAIKATTGTFMERGQAARELDIMMRHDTGVAKARGVAAEVRILLENGEPVLLAGWHREVYRIWLEELAEFKPVMYTGTESPAEKEKAKNAFINGETNLMIISLISGSGLDGLQYRCRTVVIGELHWSPKVHDQLIGRVDRDGSTEQTTAIFLVTDQGSDPLIIDILGLKASQSHAIINPLQAPAAQHSDESRMKQFAKKFLASRNIAVPETDDKEKQNLEQANL